LILIGLVWLSHCKPDTPKTATQKLTERSSGSFTGPKEQNPPVPNYRLEDCLTVSSEEKLAKEVIVSANVGDCDECFHAASDPSQYIDLGKDGNLYIFDPELKKINAYTRDGKRIKTIHLSDPGFTYDAGVPDQDFAVGKNKFYILSTPIVNVYDKDGNLLFVYINRFLDRTSDGFQALARKAKTITIDIPLRFNPPGEGMFCWGLWKDTYDNVYIGFCANADESHKQGSPGEIVNLDFKLTDKPVLSFLTSHLVIAKNVKYGFSYLKNMDGEFLVKSTIDGRKIIKKIKLLTPDKKLGCSGIEQFFSAEDKSGNIYLMAHKKTFRKSQIIKLTPDHQFIRLQPEDYDSFHKSSKVLDLESGIYYTVNARAENVEVIRWKVNK